MGAFSLVAGTVVDAVVLDNAGIRADVAGKARLNSFREIVLAVRVGVVKDGLLHIIEQKVGIQGKSAWARRGRKLS